MRNIFHYVINKDIKKLMIFWLLYSILGCFISISIIGIKPFIGIYSIKKISMNNIIVEVTGRSYDKAILIYNENNKYEAACMDEYNLICEDFFQKGNIRFEKIEFVQMTGRKGFIVYSEFIDPISNQKTVIDKTNEVRLLESDYLNKDRFIRVVIMIPFIITIFFFIIWIWKKVYYSEK